MENGDAVADACHGSKIMRNVKNSHSGGEIELAKERKNFGLSDHIESTRGFVGDQQRRTMQDGHRDEHTLGLAHAHLRRIFALEFIAGWKQNVLQSGLNGVCAIRLCSPSRGPATLR